MASLLIERDIYRHKSASGQSLVEYGLILALVSVASIGGLQLLGNNMSSQFTSIASAFGGVSTSSAGVTGYTGGAPSPSPSSGGSSTTTSPPPSGNPVTNPGGSSTSSTGNPPTTTPGNPPTTTSGSTTTTPGSTTTTPPSSTAAAAPNCSGTGCAIGSSNSGGW